jgi:TPR repeat protein
VRLCSSDCIRLSQSKDHLELTYHLPLVFSYFTEVGIGTIRDERDAISWFKKAAEHGDKRAITRLKTLGVNFESPDVLSPTKRSPSSPRDMRAAQNHSSNNDRHSAADMLGPKSAVTRGRAAGVDTPNANAGKSSTSDYGGSNASKRKSRRNTLPGLMGMSNKTTNQSDSDVPPVPTHAAAGKKDADCIIS